MFGAGLGAIVSCREAKEQRRRGSGRCGERQICFLRNNCTVKDSLLPPIPISVLARASVRPELSLDMGGERRLGKTRTSGRVT